MSDELRLDGKVALITGAARRVGRAIALELGRAGARVWVHHHTGTAAAARTASSSRPQPNRAPLRDAPRPTPAA